MVLALLSAHERWVVTEKSTAEKTRPVTPVEMNLPMVIDLPLKFVILK